MLLVNDGCTRNSFATEDEVGNMFLHASFISNSFGIWYQKFVGDSISPDMIVFGTFWGKLDQLFLLVDMLPHPFRDEVDRGIEGGCIRFTYKLSNQCFSVTM